MAILFGVVRHLKMSWLNARNKKIQKSSSIHEDDFLSILEKLPERLHDGDLELVATAAILLA